jgi:hypothetical protein
MLSKAETGFSKDSDRTKRAVRSLIGAVGRSIFGSFIEEIGYAAGENTAKWLFGLKADREIKSTESKV